MVHVSPKWKRLRDSQLVLPTGEGQSWDSAAVCPNLSQFWPASCTLLARRPLVLHISVSGLWCMSQNGGVKLVEQTARSINMHGCLTWQLLRPGATLWRLNKCTSSSGQAAGSHSEGTGLFSLEHSTSSIEQAIPRTFTILTYFLGSGPTSDHFWSIPGIPH